MVLFALLSLGLGETTVSVFVNQHCRRGPSATRFENHAVFSGGPCDFDFGWVRISRAECRRRVLWTARCSRGSLRQARCGSSIGDG